MATLAPPHIRGRMLDADAHLYMEPDVMEEILRPLGRDWIIDMLEKFRAAETFEADRARALEDVWKVKGLAAQGSCDPEGRVRAMDAMGVQRQLLFPNTLGRENRVDTPEAHAVIRAYNDYALDWTHRTGGRAVAVCQLNLLDREKALAEARRVVEGGARAVYLSLAAPPGGTSPANPAWDPLWEMIEANDVAACLHIGSCGQFSAAADDPILVPRALWDSPTLRSSFPDEAGNEERLGPVWAIIACIPAELVLTMIVMGGVFERFPRLRMGCIEFGAQWVGSWVERMDQHAGLLAKVGAALPLKPSEYVSRNLRVTPFPVEPVGTYIDRYGLEEVYMFSTDYPHLEGGRDPVGKFLGHIAGLGPAYAEKFFVTNAELLLPDGR